MKGESREKDQEKKFFSKVKTYTIPVSVESNKKNITIDTDRDNQVSRSRIISQAYKFHSEGNFSEAIRHYQYFVEQGFIDAKVFCNYGALLKDIGNLKDAEIFTRKAIEIECDNSIANSNLSAILLELGELKQAKAYAIKGTELDPLSAQAFVTLGSALSDMGELISAEIATRKAIELQPDFFNAYYNLSHILIDLKKFKEAEISTREAIRINPLSFKIYYTLGYVLRELNDLSEAEKSAYRAIELNPEYAEAYSLLGIINLQINNHDKAIKYYSKSANILRKDRNNNPNQLESFGIINKSKIDHDIEQFKYLANKGINSKEFNQLAFLYKKISSEIDWPSDTERITIESKHDLLLKNNYNLLLHKEESPKIKGSTLNCCLDNIDITNKYFQHEFGFTYIDDFLSPVALKLLREFLLRSTIWFSIKENGYLGAFMKEGFFNPLILQISEDLRKKFPEIFKDHALNQVWAFKYSHRSKEKTSSIRGINIHADFAAINVNFWVTSSDSNLNPDSGGLIVYDVEAPKEWDFKTYNRDVDRIKKELKRSKGNTKVVPYKGNRAVIFNSNLFHETDDYEFKEGYEHRRINVTMLFGTRN